MGWTVSGLYRVALAIVEAFNNENIKVALYLGSEKIKELTPTISNSGSTVIVHAEDNSADEYTFDMVVIEAGNGTHYIELPVGSQDKANIDRVLIDVTIPLSGA